MTKKGMYDTFIRIGWSVENEHQDDTITWTLKNADGFVLEVELRDYSMMTVSSVVSIPKDEEDVWMAWEPMSAFLLKEAEKGNYMDWDGDYLDELKVSRYYTITLEDPMKELDGRSVRGVLRKQMTLHKRVEKKLMSVVEKIREQKMFINRGLTPENSIRMDNAGMHGAFPSLTAAWAYYDKYMEFLNGEPVDCTADMTSYLGDIVLYNLCYRNYLRENGVKAMIDKLVSEHWDLDPVEVKRELEDKWEMIGRKLGNVDIRYVGRREAVEILGETYHGVEDFLSADKKPEVRMVCKPYPKFDIYDVLYDNRMYQLFAFAKYKKYLPSGEELRRMMGACSTAEEREKLELENYTLVYDGGDSASVLLITAHGE